MKVIEGFVVPHGIVTVKVGRKGTRDYQQGQFVPKGSVIVEAYPDSLIEDLGGALEKKKKAVKE